MRVYLELQPDVEGLRGAPVCRIPTFCFSGIPGERKAMNVSGLREGEQEAERRHFPAQPISTHPSRQWLLHILLNNQVGGQWHH